MISGVKYSQRPVTIAVPRGPVLLNVFINHLDKGQMVSSASLLMIQNWEEGLVHEIVVSHLDGPRQAGEMGREEPH